MSVQHKVDCVIHFAALKAVGESCSLPLKYYGNNVTGSSNLMEVMMECGVKKIVFSSSATVYGCPEYLPLDESHPTGKCTNPYGKTKYFMEEIMKDVCAANEVRLTHNVPERKMLMYFLYHVIIFFRTGVAFSYGISIQWGRIPLG